MSVASKVKICEDFSHGIRTRTFVSILAGSFVAPVERDLALGPVPQGVEG